MKKLLLFAMALGMMAFASIASAATLAVPSNATAPGDDFTNAGTGNTNPATPGAALGNSGWYYNNVRNNGHVGVRTALPYDGNGSVWFSATQGPGGASSKADIEFYNVVGGAAQSLGTLGDLSSFSYSWDREAGGTANAWLHPVLRLYVASPDATKAGYLVFERDYQTAFPGNPAAPTGQWQTDDIVANNYRLWSTGSLPNSGVYYSDQITLGSWKTNYGAYNVLGISAGVGSGWGTFTGAVDDITLGFGGTNTTYNFEVVPEPGTLVLLVTAGLGALCFAWRRRRS